MTAREGSLNCPGCGAANRDGARFCIACGASLALRCAGCGNELPTEARFCDGCGAPVTAGPQAEPVAAARKVVTVLFADMTGSTALEEHMDAEPVRALLDRIYADLRKDVEGHGGRVVKFTGDGLMAAFGVPEVHEDDADRAISSAAAMRQTMSAIADDAGQPIALKVGVNTGEVVVIEEDDDVVGDSVNVASRLEGAASAGEILVGETTWRLTRASWSYEAIEPLVVKGKSEPVPAYRLLSVVGALEETFTPPFVGREEELDELLAVFDDAVEANAARLVTIVGSPGLGKTRLAHEFAARLAERAVVRESRCDPAGSATFAPIAETIRSAASIPESAEATEIVEALKAIVPIDEPDRDRIATLVGALLGAGRPGSTEQTFWALRRLIEATAAELPRVLILDDLHWAEPLLLDLVEHLAEWIRTSPVLLVVTGRPELRDVRPALVEGGRAAAVIALEGLDENATEQLAIGLLGSEHVPRELIARIPSSTEGNPLFVRELVRMLVDDGVLRREGDAWHLTVDVEAVEVPPTIQSLLAARMDRLGAQDRAVVELASVIGKEFYKGAVAELASPAVREVLDGCLESLRRKELVEPVGTYWIDEPVYRFHHALIRDAAYRRLLKETRAELHERVATWFEDKTRGLLGEHEELVGYHLEQAHEYKRQLGRGDDELGARAAELLRTAAQRALDRDDVPGAASLSGRALAHLPAEDEESRAELLLMRCEALLSMGDVTQATPAVADFLHSASTPRLAAWGTCFSGHLANLTSGGLEETESEVAAAAQELTELGDMAGAAKAHTVRATALAGLGRFADCEAVLDEALTAARRAEGRRRSVTATLGTAPQAQVWGPNPVSRAGGRCLDLVRLLRITTGSLAVEQTSLRCQAVLEAFRGRTDAARGMLRKVRRALTELGLDHKLLEAEQYAGVVEFVAGDAAAALGHLQVALEGFRRFGSDVLAAQTAALLAGAHLLLGEEEEAEKLLALEELSTRDVKAAMAWRSVKAELLSRRGDFERAKALAEEAVALGEPTDALVDHGLAYRQLAQVLRTAGDAEGARRADERASALFERKGATALMDDLRISSAPLSTKPPVPGVPYVGTDNDAARAARLLYEALEHEDWDAYRALHRADCTIEDRRPGLGMRGQGSDEMVAIGRTIRSVGVQTAGWSTVAVRGRYLTLGHVSFRAGPGSFEALVLQLAETDEDGLLIDLVSWEPRDADAAFAELDARFLAGEDAADAGVGLWQRFVEAYNDRDWTTVRALFVDDFTFVDHRLVSLGEIHDPDRYVQALRQLTELVPGRRCYLTAFPASTSPAAICSLYIPGVTPDGVETEDSMHLLGVLDGDRFGRIEHFPGDRLDTALVRFEELSSEATSSPLENAALRALLRGEACAMRAEWDGVRGDLADEAVFEDRRQGLGWRWEGKDAIIEQIRTATPRGMLYDETPLATRGERLCLTRQLVHLNDFEVESLIVYEIDADGLGCSCVFFDPDDFDAAVTELDSRFVAAEGKTHARAMRLARATLQAMNDRDWSTYRAMVADDLVQIDHRPVGLGSIEGADEHVKSIRQLAEVVPHVYFWIAAIHRIDPGRALVRLGGEATTDHGGSLDVSVLNIYEFDQTVSRIESFRLDQLDVAMARFEELTAERPSGALVNSAVRASRRLADCLLHRDWEGAKELFTEESFEEDRRSGPVSRIVGADARLENLRAVAGVGVTRVSHETIATRGEYLALVRSRFTGDDDSSSRTEILGVVEVDPDGRHKANIVFDPDDLEAAFAELDERYLSGEGRVGADVLSCVVGFIHAIRARDWAGFRSYLSDDFVLRDHRLASLGELTAQEWAEAWKVFVDLAPDMRPDIVTYHALAPDACVYEVRSHGSTTEGALVETLVRSLSHVRDGLMTTCELFPAERLDAAVARFEELRAGDPGLTNACSRSNDRVAAAFAERDWESVTASFVMDAYVEDRRPGLRNVVRGRDAIVANLRELANVGGVAWNDELLATRGDRLALHRLSLVGPPGRDVDVRILDLTGVDADGRITFGIHFEPDDLDAAFAELDERYARGEGVMHGEVVRSVARFMESYNARDWDVLRACMSEGHVLVDHRPASAGEVHGPDALVDYQQVLIELVPDLRSNVVTFHALGPFGALIELHVHGTAEHGGPIEFSWCETHEVRDGRLVRTDRFAPEDLDAARARFDELGAEPHPLTNLTDQAAREIDDAVFRGDWDAVRQRFRPDVTWEDRRRGMATRLDGIDAVIENFRAMADIGVRQSDRSILALRGDRLILSRVRFSGAGQGSFETEVLAVFEGDDGRAQAIVAFDPDDLEAAFAELDGRYAAGEGEAFADTVGTIAALTLAWNARGWEAVAALLDPRFVLIDHRPLGSGTVEGPEAFIEATRAWMDVAPDMRRHIARYHALADGAAVIELVGRAAPHGGEIEVTMQVAVCVSRGRLTHMEVFPDDRVDAALARFEEFAS